MCGNSTYIKDVFDKFELQHQGPVGAGVKFLGASFEKNGGKEGPKFGAKINDLINNLGKFDHCSQLIYYESAEGEPELLSAIDFSKKTLEAAVENIKFKDSEAKPSLGLHSVLDALGGPADFKDIPEYLFAVHGVLPYASESTPLMPAFTSAAPPCDLTLSAQHAAPIWPLCMCSRL